jgi:hypothetical protein
VVLVPSTAHYSWEKICRALGIGGAQLVHVPVDRRFRMDPAALERHLHGLAAAPAAGDRLRLGDRHHGGERRRPPGPRGRRARSRRSRAGRRLRLHADAAYGGYAASVTRGPDGERRSYEETLRDFAPEVWPEEGSTARSRGAGAHRLRHHRSAQARLRAVSGRLRLLPRRAFARPGRRGGAVPLPRGASEWGYIGRFIFEGSKPGASAAGVWMSHKVLPLDSRGYGKLIGETARGALVLHRRLTAGDWGRFRVVPLPAPDLNIVCFAVGHPALTSLEANQRFREPHLPGDERRARSARRGSSTTSSPRRSCARRVRPRRGAASSRRSASPATTTFAPAAWG